MSTQIVRRQTKSEPQLTVSPLLRRIYANRQINTANDLDHSLQTLPKPSELLGMDKAVELLVDALRRQQRILIVADYDADGATSCALGIRALQALGAQHVSYVVPNRFEYGYGLTPEIVAVAAEQKPDLIITVDNGISSLAGVAAAKALGIQVLITDHHLPGAELPDADAIVNPNQPGDEFPSKNLAGVGVMFYVLLALRARLRQDNWFAEQNLPEPNMAKFLDLVAFGTVADVVALDRINRVLVEQGLKRIRAGHCLPGITALLGITRRTQEHTCPADIGFALGPRLNAAGRLDDMSYGIQCLLCDDLKQSRAMAWQLDSINRERRDIEADMLSQALEKLENQLGNAETELPFGLCLYDETWHQGVIGILASRIKDRTHRPVIAFAPENDDHIKGSARSVPGFHIRDALDAVATQNPGLLNKFGGHAMAAGMSIPLASLATFSDAFDTEVRRHLQSDDLQGVLHSDGELTPNELCLEVAEELRNAGPWGQSFPEPLFDGIFEVINHRVLGQKHLKMVLRPPGVESIIDAIAFNKVPEFGEPTTRQVRIAYRLDVNEWQGRRNPQLIVEHIEAV